MNTITCPIPVQEREHIQLAHGGGGKLTQELIETIFYPAFKNDILEQEHDSAQIAMPEGRIAFTTDSFVVDPVFFPGGDIGELAVNGTVNDLLCSGAVPQYISVGFIIEEGFAINDLKKIVQSIANAARKANVKIVTGDTKVVERIHGNQIYINTSGIGSIPESVALSPKNVKHGDSVIVTGRIGEHGICVLSTRNSLGFETDIKSDTRSLNEIVRNLLKHIPQTKVLRDPTRGGLSSTLNEIAHTAGVGIEINEEALPVSKGVESACELLGLDPLYIANEGILLVFVPEEHEKQALEIIRNSEHGADAMTIGKVIPDPAHRVYLQSAFGGKRIVEVLSGEQLPRIC
ncbi:MAG: hydrogenase expression/formation protein HypE [Bacteroidales bacterium]